MNKYHKSIQQKIKSSAPKNFDQNENKKYHGNDHYCYGLRVPVMRQIVKKWLQEYKDITEKDFISFIKELYASDSYEEKCMGGMILGYAPSLRSKITLQVLDQLLSELVGWAEIDSTCQSNFTAKELLTNWEDWSQFLVKLSKSQNINKRRASIVLLNKSVEGSSDPRLSSLAFKIINTLQSEKNILITKAISWSLRSLIKNHSHEVSTYLLENQGTLPKIAVRETQTKLSTGKKYHYPKRG
jgi:3-methyladenine DNA glycosylase AlkD